MSTAPDPKPPRLTLEALARIDEVCTQFELARQQGEDLPIEQLAAGVEGPERQQLLLELLLIDFAQRSDEDLDQLEADYRMRLPKDGGVIQLAVQKQREQYERRSSSNHTVMMSSPVAQASKEDVLPESNGEEPKRVRYFGEYEILDEIARGGMGVVFKARQKTLKRTVALKMILTGRLADQEEINRFKREAQAASRLQHANIVAIHEIGEHKGRHYFTMDFIDGSSLADVLREETLAPVRAANLVRTISEAVQYAHGKGTIHRDLKPANVLLSRSGTPHVTDFGLAKVFDDRDADSWQRLTETGQVVGTPSYMSPEQAAGKINLVGPVSDIWSLGAVLYACLTGRPPFLAETQVDTILQVMHKEPVTPRELNPAVPKDLETICLKCLNKEPHRRYGTAQELADDLQRFIEGRPVLARPVGRTAKLLRWAKRSPVVASLTALSVLLLISGTGISSYFAVQAHHRAEAEKDAKLYAQSQEQIAEEALGETQKALAREEVARADAEAEKKLAQQAQKRAEIATIKEIDQRKKTEAEKKRAQWQTYVARLQPMRQAWLEKEFGHLDRLLQESISKEGEPDFRGWEWHYFQDQVNQASERIGSSSDFRGFFDYDSVHNRILAAVGGTNWQVWDLSENRLTETIPLEDNFPLSVHFSPDGERIAWGTNDCRLRIWDISNKRLIHDINAHTNVDVPAAYIRYTEWSPDGDLIVTSTVSGEINVWNATSGDFVRQLQKASGAKTSLPMCWHKEAGLATGQSSGIVRVWAPDLSSILWEKRLPQPIPSVVQWNPSGTHLISTGEGTIILDRNGNEVTSLEEVGGQAAIACWLDDDKISLGGTNQDIRIYDISKNTNLEIVKLHSGRIQSLSPSVTGALITGGNEGAIYQYQVGFIPSIGQKIRAHPGSKIWGLDWEPNGSRIATASRSDSAAILWDASTGKIDLELQGQQSQSVNDITWSPRGDQLISIDAERIALWDQRNGTLLKTIHVPDAGVRTPIFAIDWIPHRDLIAMTCLASGHIRFFTTDTLVATGHQQLPMVWCWPSFSPDGSRIAVVSSGNVSVIDSESGKTLFTRYKGDKNFGGHGTCWSRDARLLAAGGSRIEIINADSYKSIIHLSGHRGEVRDLSFDPTGTRLASVGGDSNLVIWDVATGDMLLQLSVPDEHGLEKIEWSPDGRRIALTTTDGNLWILGSPKMPEMPKEIDFLRDGVIASKFHPPEDATEFVLENRHSDLGTILNIAATPDGRFLALTGYFNGLKLWDLQKAEVVDRFETLDEGCRGIDIDSTGKYVATASHTSGKIHIWDLNSGAMIRSFHAHNPQPQSKDGNVYFWVRFFPDGKRVISYGQDHFVRIWNLQGELQFELDTQMQIYHGAFTPNGDSFIFGGSGGGRVMVLDLKTFTLHQLTKHHNQLVRAVAVTSDSQYLLTGDHSGIIRLTDLNSSEETRIFDDARFVTQLQFLPGDQYFLSAGRDGLLRLWDIGQNHKPVAEIKDKESIFETIALLNGGRTVVTTGMQTNPVTRTSRALHFWELPKMLWSDDEPPEAGPEP